MKYIKMKYIKMKHIKRIFVLLLFVMGIFLINNMPAKACTKGMCRYLGEYGDGYSCGCGKNHGSPCWYKSPTDLCHGHQLQGIGSTTITSTCTSAGSHIDYYNCKWCGEVSHSYTTPYNALGHILSGWYSNASGHWKYCTRPVGHSGSDALYWGQHT